MRLKFWKISAAGNDFVMLAGDQLSEPCDPTRLAVRLCDRHFGIGADGLIIVERAPEAAFAMRYYNADGSGPVMCGNGARAAVLFAREILQIRPAELSFLAPDGTHWARVGADQIQVTIRQPQELRQVDLGNVMGYWVDTGAPHLVVIGAERADFTTQAPLWRRQWGANVNFVRKLAERHWQIRTYERGVEGETLACGTGATAAAFVLHTIAQQDYPLYLQAVGGRLTITCESGQLWLAGPTQLIFQGQIALPKQ